MLYCAKFNRDWMSKDQYRAWLTQKGNCKLCTKMCSLSNMGKQTLKSYAAGMKHIIVMTQTQKTDSVTDFFTVKCGATPGASSSASLGEPLVCDTEDINKDSGSLATHRNPLTKCYLRQCYLGFSLLLELSRGLPSYVSLFICVHCNTQLLIFGFPFLCNT